MSTQSTQAMSSPWALVGRLCWMIVGPFALAISAISIATRGGGWPGPLDLIYFVVLGGTLLGRRLEFRHGQPLTAAGEQATEDHWRRYAGVLIVLGLVVWLAARVAGHAAGIGWGIRP